MAKGDNPTSASMRHARATGGTSIIRTKSTGETLRISPQGNVSARPSKSTENRKLNYTATVVEKNNPTGKVTITETGTMQVPKTKPKGTQAGHTVTGASGFTKSSGGGAINWQTK